MIIINVVGDQRILWSVRSIIIPSDNGGKKRVVLMAMVALEG